jgi:branched-subunit amino acid aminotransferase/4-amino-4-deoxychorismate lyase
MPAVALVDGAIVPLAAARVPVTDRGFLWGDHAFEIVRAVDGRPLDGDAHLERLGASAGLLRMPAIDRAAVARALAETLAAAAEPDAAARIVVTRGDAAGLGPRAGARTRLVILVEPLGPAPAAAPGVRLHSLAGHRGGLVPAAAKSGNYLGSVLALAAAADAGADDALLHDGDRVLETATGSLLVVTGGAIVSPTGPLLPGVTAARIAALLAARGHPVQARPVHHAEAATADELLVTSARRGVAPVTALDGVGRAPGPIFAQAAAAYAAWIEDVRRGAGL